MRTLPRQPALLLASSALLVFTACNAPTAPLADGVRSEPAYVKRTPPPPPPVLSGRTPILFVHGFNSSATTWNTMVSRFRTDGWTAAELHAFSYDFSRSNATTASLIAKKVDSIRTATGAPKVAIVTHSMGSLSARYFLRTLGGSAKVSAMVSLAGVDHGTSSAYICFQTSCVEMRAGSTFLTNLNATDETWGETFYATWRSPCDEVVNPRSSTILAGATNTETACLPHSQLKEDATVFAQVRGFITAPTGPTVLALAP